MRFVFYSHSLVSDWNHGNAHFQRGILRELMAQGHEALALEPEDSWSRGHLLQDQGPAAIARFADDFPGLKVERYGPSFDHAAALADADVVVVHEWTSPELIAGLGRLRRGGAGFTLLFHDTHHRAISAERAIADLVLQDYDGILVFGETLRERYLQAGWGRRVFTWHEAADTVLFRPMTWLGKSSDLVWVGNWGDEERSAEIRSLLIEPARRLCLVGDVHGVRYPGEALRELQATGLRYRGWVANADVPEVFARHRVTLHIPRRPYREALPGIPTIRVFEALACGIPLVCAPWQDSEGLFRPGDDYLVAGTPDEMSRALARILLDRALADSLAASGLKRVRAHHTCRHRVAELMQILAAMGRSGATGAEARREAAE